MTLLEKIKNYKWFDSPNKLKPILEELYNSTGGGSGGGSQDLQSVLDKGSTAENLTKNGNFYINYKDENDTGDGAVFQITNFEGNEKISLFTQTDFQQGNIYSLAGKVVLNESNTSTFSNITLKFPDTPISIGNVFIELPNKPNGWYTLATLDDIKKIDLTGRVYENNAAAISGGLTANDVYRTSTGELRIVV